MWSLSTNHRAEFPCENFSLVSSGDIAETDHRGYDQQRKQPWLSIAFLRYGYHKNVSVPDDTGLHPSAFHLFFYVFKCLLIISIHGNPAVWFFFAVL